MVRPVARRSMAMAVQRLVARQQALERGEEVVIGSRADLDDDHARGRVRDEDGQQPVVLGRDELGAGAGQVGEAADRAGPDRELDRPYGKMLRSASRIRPRPPFPGADS